MRSILGGALAAVLLVGVSAVPAVAADAPARLTWSVQPATATGLDTRPNISLTASEGQRKVDFVAVSNYSTKPLTLDLYATDAFNTDKGEFSLLESAKKPTDVGTWITLKKNKITVPARSKTTVPFSIDVPANASPGDHTGGIVASLTTAASASKSGKVAIEQRAGTRVYVRVLGEVQAALVVDDVSTKYEGSTNPVASGTAVVTYTVRNTGNTRMAARRSVEVAGPFGLGSTTGAASALPELLPGQKATFTERVGGVRPLVRLTATVTLEPIPLPASEGAASMPPVTGSASTWAISWTLLAIVVLLALLAAFLLRRRSRRKVVAASAPEPTGRRARARAGLDLADAADAAPSDEDPVRQ